MSSSIPQRHSPQFTPVPLPLPSRRPTHRATPSFTDSDDGSFDSHNSNSNNSTSINHVMTQYPYQDPDEDPLRALCYAMNVAKTAPSTARHLTKPHELAVLNRASPILPTHLLAIHDAPLTDPNVLLTLIPINIDAFSRKLPSTDLLGARHSPHPPTRVLPSAAAAASPPSLVLSPSTTVPRIPPSLPLPPTLTVPLVPLQVPHVPSVALLLLYVLNVRTNPSALAASLLPLSVAEEFPSAAAMAQAMAVHCQRDTVATASDAGSGAGDSGLGRGGGGGAWLTLDRYAAYNQGMWKNVLALGLQDSRVISVVQTVWNVTAESRKILTRQQRERQHDVNNVNNVIA
ncbi:hypothetical protein F5148DRAFT_141356 [Russula earlei]|uniref:Uncharacterized protein n=1 Tax=Russula earlei TaxID=71964 RepID=A0ACC0U6I8_9AGAM|nr:hypothetical protein F5148DRAFT_141356 [Russula earlei]